MGLNRPHTLVSAVAWNCGKKRNECPFLAERSRARAGEASYGGLCVELSNNEKRMLKALRSRPTDVWGLDEVLAACNWEDQAHAAVLQELSS